MPTRLRQRRLRQVVGVERARCSSPTRRRPPPAPGSLRCCRRRRRRTGRAPARAPGRRASPSSAPPRAAAPTRSGRAARCARRTRRGRGSPRAPPARRFSSALGLDTPRAWPGRLRTSGRGGRGHPVGRVRGRGRLADRAVVGVDVQRREELPVARARRGLGGCDPLVRGEVSRRRDAKARLQRGLERDLGDRRVGNLVRQRERLPGRQPDRPCELQLRASRTRSRRGSTRWRWFCSWTCARSTSMPATRPECFMSDAWVKSASRGLFLRVRGLDAARAGDRLEIQVDRDQRDQVTRGPDAERLGALVGRGRARAVDRAQCRSPAATGTRVRRRR